MTWKILDRQASACLVELDALTQKVRFEADRHAFSAAGVAPVLVERALVGGEAFGDPVFPCPGEVGERLGAVFIHQLG